jgi:carboxypeptidase C (cathepsin A)
MENNNLMFFFFEKLNFVYCFEGPGCSSLGVGAFSENGPFRPKGDALVRNQFSWNTGSYILLSNVLNIGPNGLVESGIN